jgi:sporulation protein YlmC with PRC-barrel domain
MKSFIAGLAMMTLAALVGCSQGTPGGPGTAETQPTYGQADNTFNLSVPVMSSSLQQGEQTEATVGIKRAKNFDEDVALKFTNVPQGVTVEPANPVIKHGDTEAKITFQAGDEALLGDFKVNVTGHPTKGTDAQIEFKLTIDAKDSFTLSTPRRSTSLKQGETQTVAVGINRDKSFDQDVALTFGEMPTGVTFNPEAPVIKHGETEAQVTLTAAEDAALGSFAIKVTGHPAKGAGASNELNLTVAKKSEEERAAVAVSTPGLATPETDDATKPTEGSTPAGDDPQIVGELASSQMIFRSTALSGMDVFNRTDATVKLGSLENLVINAHTGQVLFGVLDTGLGGKLIPAPWNVLQLQADANTQKTWLTLDKTGDELRKSPTIEKDSVVDMTDAKWLQSLDTFFSMPTAAQPVEKQAKAGELTTNEMIFRSSDLHGMNVSNRSDASVKLGSISDLIVDAHTGQVLYGLLETESGGTLIATPWNAFQLKQDAENNKSELTLNKTSEELKTASTIDKSHMPDFTEMKWRQTVDDFFGVRTGARPSETNR